MKNKIITTEQLQYGLRGLQVEILDAIARFEKECGTYANLTINTITVPNKTPMEHDTIVAVKCTVQI